MGMQTNGMTNKSWNIINCFMLAIQNQGTHVKGTSAMQPFISFIKIKIWKNDGLFYFSQKKNVIKPCTPQ